MNAFDVDRQAHRSLRNGSEQSLKSGASPTRLLKCRTNGLAVARRAAQQIHVDYQVRVRQRMHVRQQVDGDECLVRQLIVEDAKMPT